MENGNMNFDNIQKSMKDEFCVWSEVFRQNIEKEISEEYILPDYLPDIRKILLVQAHTAKMGVYKEDKKASVSGEVLFNVIYLGDDGKIKCICRDNEFESSVSSESIYDESFLKTNTRVKSKSARALSPRKILLKAKVLTDFIVYNKLCVYPRVIGGNGIEDEFTLERSTNQLDCINYIRLTENDVRVSEDITLNGGRTIKEIICCDVEFGCADAKLVENGITIKSNARVWMLLEYENGEYEVVEKSIPINHNSQQSLPQGDWCISVNLEMGEIEFELVNDSYGEMRVVELDFSAKADMIAMSNEVSIFTDDVYSTAFAYQNKYKTVNTQRLNKCNNANFSAYGSAEIPLTDGEKIEKILLSTVECEIKSNEIQNNKAVISGDAFVKAVFELSDNTYKNFEFSFPVRYEMPIESENVILTTNCCVLNHKCSFEGNRFNTNAEIGLGLLLLENVNATVVENIALDKEKKAANFDDRVMILYYPSSNETLWGIAKKYGISKTDIEKLNKLTTGNGDEPLPRVLLIPTNLM